LEDDERTGRVAGETLGDVIRRIGRSAGLQGDLGLTDAQLLERFVARRDEPAFAALVARHGPMVYGVCRRLLRDAGEAEDAFQAAFLVLARKAASVRRRPLLAAWLYGVASRVAARLRGQGLRRRARERPDADLAAVAAADAPAETDLAPVVHEEVRRLPEKYRDPVVLCYLEGKTNEEAAAALHWPVGSVKGRLARARDLLRSRLARRGLAPSAGLSASLAMRPAPVSAALAHATVTAAARFAAGGGLSGLASARAAALTHGVLRVMAMKKMVFTAALTLCVAAGAGWLVDGLATAGPGQPGALHSYGPPNPLAGLLGLWPNSPAPAKEDKDAIQGTWQVTAVEMGGQDVSGTDEFKDLAHAQWVIAADKMTFKTPGRDDQSATYKIDPSKKPKELDVTPLQGPANEKGQLMPAIYGLEDDVLKICVAPPPLNLVAGGPPQPPLARPTELATKEGGKTVLITLRREKADKDKPADKPEGDKDAIPGVWQVTSVQVDGKEAPDEGEFKKIKAAKWVFTADKVTVRTEGEKDAPATYRLDPSKKPKELDVTPEEGPNNEKGKVMPAIYSLEGDVLKICAHGPEDGPRPTELATKEGGKTILLTLKREK
jgi:RNA polymerase sigma factor (sigma-70 family)